MGCPRRQPLPKDLGEKAMYSDGKRISKALYVCDLGTRTAQELNFVANICTSTKRDELRSLAERISLCNSKPNSFIQPNFQCRHTGETYTKIDRFWRCNSKLCQSCLTRQTRKNRKKLTDAISRTRLAKNERWSFVTFTIPKPDLTLVECRSIIDRAWCLFRKRSFCVALVRGGAKSEEFTISKSSFHYHLHCLFISKWFLWTELRRVWTDCVRQAFADHDRPFEVNTSSGLVVVNVKQVTNLTNVIREVCKYITKGDSWSKLQQADLIEIASIRRWSRMFELLGCLRDANDDEREASPPHVHKEHLSDGGFEPSPHYWRDVVNEIGFEAYQTRLRDEFEQAYYAKRREQIFWQGDPTIIQLSELDEETTAALTNQAV
jgi:hypothetical protein